MGDTISWPYRTNVLALCMSVYFGVRLSTAAVSALGSQIVAALGISFGLFGFAITGAKSTAALVQLPSGALSDTYGERKVILSAVVLAGSGTVLLALSPSYTLFLTLAVLIGVGGGLYYSPSTVLLDELYDRTGRALGVFRIGGQSAGIAAPLLVAGVGIRHGWRSALLVVGLLLVPIGLGLSVFMRPTTPASEATALHDRLRPRRLRALLSRPPIAVTTLFASLTQFVDVAAFALLPLGLQRYHGLSPAFAAALYGLYFVFGALFQPMSGWLSDRFDHRWVIGGTLLAGVVGFCLLTARASPVILAVAVGFVGVSRTWAPPVQARFLHHLRAGDRGTGFGLVRTIYLLVGALGATTTGTVASTLGWSYAFATLAAVLCVCVSILLAITAWSWVERRGAV
ncbi:MFS transporter [Halegenticoccus tardaugens]|uniref:MFS transporter n=1 Tax=Halegenticoccus tardaugens TaxID=2071624 RepID=UPI00100AF58D|nr:MFS transporter [Halegenticoccus tardaugens]